MNSKNARKLVTGTVLTGSLVALLSGCVNPTIRTDKDFTGDGIKDAAVNISSGLNNGTWLYIGQKDGSYVTSKECLRDGKKDFKTDGGVFYSFDGQYYRPDLR